MRRDWGRCKISSKKVVETCSNARKHCASGLDRIGAKSQTSENQNRDFRRAMGWPPNAPEIKFIDVPTPTGIKPHPIFCPIDVFEALVADEPMFNKRLVGEPGEIEKY